MSSESVASTAASPLPAHFPITPQNSHKTHFPVTPQKNPTIPNRTPPSQCFNCNQDGHWIKDCPQKKSPVGPSPVIPVVGGVAPVRPTVQCNCGCVCLVLTSHTWKNPGKEFYTCPNRENQCGFFKWCDEVIPGQHNGFRSPAKGQRGFGRNSPWKTGLRRCDRDSSNPICTCGAGRSIILMDEDEFYGRQYFGCPVKKGQGACNFRQWRREDPAATEAGEAINISKPEATIALKEPHFNLVSEEPNPVMVTAGVGDWTFSSRPERMVSEVQVVPYSSLPLNKVQHPDHQPSRFIGNKFSPSKGLNLDERSPAKVTSRRLCSKCLDPWFNENGHCFTCDIAETTEEELNVVSRPAKFDSASMNPDIVSNMGLRPQPPSPMPMDHCLDHKLKHPANGLSPMKRLSLEEGSPVKIGRPGKCFKCGKEGHWKSECRTCSKCGELGHWMRDCSAYIR